MKRNCELWRKEMSFVNLRFILPFIVASLLSFGAVADPLTIAKGSCETPGLSGIRSLLTSNHRTQKQRDDVLQTLKKYDEAWNKKDLATVDKILAADYVYFSSTGSITSREKTLELLVSPKYILTSAERSEIKTFRTGDTVIVSSRWKGKGTYNEEVINDDQRCSLVFIKQGKLWMLLSEHCTQIVTK